MFMKIFNTLTLQIKRQRVLLHRRTANNVELPRNLTHKIISFTKLKLAVGLLISNLSLAVKLGTCTETESEKGRERGLGNRGLGLVGIELLDGETTYLAK